MDDTGADLENTAFLLQRLQELKNWQKQQEEQLLKDQQFQLDQIFRQKEAYKREAYEIQDANEEEDQEDDTTIDQDLSSLHSEIVLPSWASRSSSSLERNREEEQIEDLVIVPSTKTFEQMLEEKLTIEQTQEQTPTEFAKTNEDTGSPKPFLRRGSGLARYEKSISFEFALKKCLWKRILDMAELVDLGI